MRSVRSWLGNRRGCTCAAIAALLVLLILSGCHKKSTSSNPGTEWDIDAKGVPKFVKTDYIDLAAIGSISRFRSAYGHDYSHDDYIETCRSMKHYFWPKGGDPGMQHNPSWTNLTIKSPVAGKVTRTMEEFAGTQVWIASDDYPAFEFRIFHIALASPLNEGDAVAEGQVLGHHGGDETMSDMAVCVSTPGGRRLVSYFDVMTDALFQTYQRRGVSSREQFIITKSERDADPLSCDGETFTSSGTLGNWVQLN
jgi:hypothetical protein